MKICKLCLHELSGKLHLLGIWRVPLKLDQQNPDKVLVLDTCIPKCSPGAAFSSILTCPLAASLTADSVLKFQPGKLEAGPEAGGEAGAGAGTRQMPRLYYLGLMLVMVAVSAAVISCNGEQLYDPATQLQTLHQD